MKDINYLKENGVDINKCLELFGDIETYNETIKEFKNSIDGKLDQIEKYYTTVPVYTDEDIIRSLFKEQAPERVIVFSSKKVKVKEIAQAFHKMGLNVGEMHSDLEQAQRDQIMREFKNGHINILVATDIVSRGIDIDDIRLVINYDVPNDCEDYVHRIGRTARANNDGCAITFVSEKEQTQFKTVEDFLEKTIYKIPVPEELGEVPEYTPKTVEKNKRKHSAKGKKGGNGRNYHRKKKAGNVEK